MVMQEPNPDNLWYRARNTSHGKQGSAGELLPKRWLRPFKTSDYVTIDNKRLVQEGIGKKEIIGFFSGLAYLAGGTAGFLGVISSGNFPELFNISGITLIIGIILHVIAKRTPVSWYTYFERDTGYFETRFGFRRKRYRIPFKDCEGRLIASGSYIGTINYSLVLTYPGIGGFLLMQRPASSVEDMLGYWSFLVQYMDNKKALPDIKALENYPNREPGLGTWKEWEERQKNPDFTDPYAVWQIELKHNPQWDLANYYMQPRYIFWLYGKYMLMLFITMFVVGNVGWFLFVGNIELMPWKMVSLLLWISVPLFLFAWFGMFFLSARKRYF
jgi:hypothetical protein